MIEQANEFLVEARRYLTHYFVIVQSMAEDRPSQRTAAPRAIQRAIGVQFGWIWLHPVDSVDEIPT